MFSFKKYLWSVLKSPSLGMLAIFTGGNIFASLLGGVGGLIQAHWVSPETFGEFRKYGILTTYFAIGTAFVHDGLCRQFPFYLGSGDREKALLVAGVAKWWYLFVLFIFSSFFAVMTLVSLFNHDWFGVCGWLTQIAVTIGTVYGVFLGVMYRTSSDFKRLSYNTIWSAVVSFLLLPFVKLWGFVGLAVRLAGTNLYSVWINRRHLPVKVKALFNWEELKSLMSMSLRFSIPGYLDTSALSATLTAILLFACGQEAVGLFAFALGLRALIMTFNQSLTQIFNVKINLKYGETKNFRKCLVYSAVPSLCAIFVSIGIYIVSVLMVNPFIHYVLPKYIAAIPIVNILFLGVVTSAIYLPLTLTRAAAMYNAIYAQCVGQVATAAVLLCVMPHDLVSIAWIQVLSGLGNCVGGYIFVLRKYFN